LGWTAKRNRSLSPAKPQVVHEGLDVLAEIDNHSSGLNEIKVDLNLSPGIYIVAGKLSNGIRYIKN
jgi:hypothetical protein